MSPISTVNSFPRLAYGGELLGELNIARMPGGTLDLQEHLSLLGSAVPYYNSLHHIKKELEQVEIYGRGGASFPLSRKIAAYENLGRSPVIVANGSESESLSKKDAALLIRFPHLVIDGLVMLGSALGAKNGYIHIKPGNVHVKDVLKQALLDRTDSDAVSVELSFGNQAVGYPGGVESAVISSIRGDAGKPIYIPTRPIVRGVKKRPTLVSNVETLAQLALLARFGSKWFAEMGDHGEAGTRLITVTDPEGMSTVIEVATGTKTVDLLNSLGIEPGLANCALVGGYFGQVVPINKLIETKVGLAGMRDLGMSLGAGIVALSSNCPIFEVSSILGYLADQTSGQCGPCFNGLPQLATLWSYLQYSKYDSDLIERLNAVADQIIGRGGCAMPDGAVLLVRSALDSFGHEIKVHQNWGCVHKSVQSIFVPQVFNGSR